MADIPQRVLKAIRTLKLLDLLQKCETLRKPASNLMEALGKILNVLIPAFFIIYIYALVGLYSFAGTSSKII